MVQKSWAAILAIPYDNDQVSPIKQVEHPFTINWYSIVILEAFKVLIQHNEISKDG